MKNISPQQLDSLRATYPDITTHQHAGVEYALRPAPGALVDRVFDITFGARATGGSCEGLAEAYANIANLTVVHPAAEERDALFARYRGLAVQLGMVAYNAAQAPRQAEEKKETPSTTKPSET